jgi:zinc protease
MANFPPVVSLNFKSPAYKDDQIDIHAIDILNSIAFSEKSPLYKKLVVEEQKVRDINGGSSNTKDPYLIEIQASLIDGKDMQYVKDEILKELTKLKTVPVSQEIVDETKMRLKYSFAMGMDSPTNIAEALSYYIWVTGDPESINRAYAMYDKITPQDIMNMANKYYLTSTLTIATISGDETCPVK